MNIGDNLSQLYQAPKASILNSYGTIKDTLGLNKKSSVVSNPATDDISKAISKFYDEKTVLKSYNFIVKFDELQYFTNIDPFYVKSITIPNFQFDIKTTNYGPMPKSYTVMGKDRPLIINIVFEDDFNASILKTAYELQSTVVDANGFYMTLPNRNLGNLKILLYSNVGNLVFEWTCVNVFFAGIQDVFDFTYDNTETLKVSLKFGCDVIKYEYYNYYKRQNNRNDNTIMTA